jgi:hypothetical protein
MAGRLDPVAHHVRRIAPTANQLDGLLDQLHGLLAAQRLAEIGVSTRAAYSHVGLVAVFAATNLSNQRRIAAIMRPLGSAATGQTASHRSASAAGR